MTERSSSITFSSVTFSITGGIYGERQFFFESVQFCTSMVCWCCSKSSCRNKRGGVFSGATVFTLIQYFKKCFCLPVFIKVAQLQKQLSFFRGSTLLYQFYLHVSVLNGASRIMENFGLQECRIFFLMFSVKSTEIAYNMHTIVKYNCIYLLYFLTCVIYKKKSLISFVTFTS